MVQMEQVNMLRLLIPRRFPLVSYAVQIVEASLALQTELHLMDVWMSQRGMVAGA